MTIGNSVRLATLSLAFTFAVGSLRAGDVTSSIETDQTIQARAAKGEAAAQNRLGFLYANGLEGVQKDAAEAVKWYRLAAEQNVPQAQYNLAFCYQNGLGVEPDAAQAVTWYRKAAERNDVAAQNNLGTCYDLGLGVAQDVTEAAKWFRKAAEQNHSGAQFNLANSYVDGQGVEKDYAAAYAWYDLASKSLDRAAEKRNGLVKKMTVEQVLAAHQLSADLQRRIVPQLVSAAK